MGREIVCIFMAMLIMATGCKATAVGTENFVPDETSALASVSETTKEPTETAVVTTAKAAQKVTATTAPTVKETTAATTTQVSETTSPATTTRATAAPAATTKAPAATTAAPAATTSATAATTATPPVETAATPVETTAAPVTDYTAVCAEIRSKLIAILEANGQWDEAFTGESTKSGSQWWGVGFYDDREMSTDDFAQHFYANKFSGRAICGTIINCFLTDGKINIEYTAYWTS